MPITIELSQIEEIYHIYGKSDIITVTYRKDFTNGYEDVVEIVCVKSTQIDGIEIKENVWYKLIGGLFVEA